MKDNKPTKDNIHKNSTLYKKPQRIKKKTIPTSNIISPEELKKIFDLLEERCKQNKKVYEAQSKFCEKHFFNTLQLIENGQKICAKEKLDKNDIEQVKFYLKKIEKDDELLTVITQPPQYQTLIDKCNRLAKQVTNQEKIINKLIHLNSKLTLKQTITEKNKHSEELKKTIAIKVNPIIGKEAGIPPIAPLADNELEQDSYMSDFNKSFSYHQDGFNESFSDQDDFEKAFYNQ